MQILVNSLQLSSDFRLATVNNSLVTGPHVTVNIIDFFQFQDNGLITGPTVNIIYSFPAVQSVFLQSSSFPMTYYPPSSNDFLLPQYPTTYYLPSSSATYQSPLEDYVYKTFREIRVELEFLDRRIAELEDRNVEDPGQCTNIIPAVGIGKVKMAAISMILTNKNVSWKAALRKILVAVFGIGTLAQSCAVGKKNSNNKCLNA